MGDSFQHLMSQRAFELLLTLFDSDTAVISHLTKHAANLNLSDQV